MSTDLDELLRQAVPLEQVDRPAAEQVWQRGRRLRARRRAWTAAGATVTVVLAVAVGLEVQSTVFDPIPPVSERPGNRAEGWSEMPAAPLEARSRHGAVWADGKLVVWGGSTRDFDYFDDGAAFDSETGEWATLPPAPLDGREHPVMAWTGDEVLVTGGMVSTGRSRQGDAEVADAGAGELHFTDGAAWDPDSGQWRAIAESPLEGRARAATAWIGQELIVWGGVDSLFTGPRTTLADGAIYDPDTDTWRTMAPAPLEPRADATAVWTGDRLIVWGGMGTETDNGLAPPNPNPLPDGAIYDPATDTWTPIANGPDFGGSPAFERHDAVWTGSRMIVWFGRQTAAYDPATDSWERLADWPADGTQVFPRAVWTGQELVTWGGWIELPEDAGSSGIGSNGYAFDPQTGDWRELPDSPSPARDDHTLTPTPAGVIIWGGTTPRTGLTALVGDDFEVMNTGVVYHP